MPFDYTPEQKSAIDAPNADILVSAAAGSGKTAVLTERIIRTLTDKESPVDLSEMLVVTFTKAAASELRSRIGDALTKACAKEPGNRFLRRQLISVGNSDISTIHSFCAKIIKKYHRQLGLPSEMRIAGDAESKLMKNDIMERTIEEMYASDDGSFSTFAENFMLLRDGKLSDKLIALYNKLIDYRDGIGTINQSFANFDRISQYGIDGTRYSEYIVKNAAGAAYLLEQKCLCCVDKLSEMDPDIFSGPLSAFGDDLAFFRKLKGMGGSSYYELRNYILSFKFTKLQPVSSANKTADYDEVCEIRKKYKDKIKKIIEEYFCTDDQKIKESAVKCSLICKKLYETLERFEESFSREKLERSLLDYSDLEHYARKLLWDGDRTSAAASEIAASYKRIYIDEYQDVSPIQDDIFRAIDRDNTFMVGDIKQSIYGFRGAAPELFASYRESFPDYTEGAGQNKHRVFLTYNFRCDKSIIDFSNAVFGQLFRNNSKRVEYLDKDQLSFGKGEEKDERRKVTVSIVRYDGDRMRKYCEARYVVREIIALQSKGVKLSDIAVITRYSDALENFKIEFEKSGLRYTSDEKRELLSEPEILLMISALKITDDPDRDIQLAALLKSPVFGFSPEELAKLSFMKERSLYTALCKAADTEENEDRNDGSLVLKCRIFKEWLRKARSYSRSHSSNDMIRYLYGECMFEAILKGASDMPTLAAADLSAFYTLASDYEAGSFKGLHNFIKYIDDLKQRGISDRPDSEKEEDEGVKLMTVHKSKGLEFKVCFVCDTARDLSDKDQKEPILLDRDLGISMLLRDRSGYVKYQTLMRKACALKIGENLIDEEMRVLYVALTRAKNKLYIVGKTADSEKLKEDVAVLSGAKCIYSYNTYRNYLCWILSSLDRNTDYELEYIENTPEYPYRIKSDLLFNASERADTEKIRSYIDFEYKWKDSAALPSKIAVSVLYPGVLDDTDDKMSSRMTAYPSFLLPEKKPTGAERGTATHLFMQFCDFEKVENNGVQSEIQSLIDKSFITAQSAKLIYTEKLGAFFSSGLYKMIKNAKAVYREYRFNVKMPASDFTENKTLAENIKDSEILVQGVIDCFFETPEGDYIIIDYKTDKACGDDPEKKIGEEYSLQLGYYRYALERLTGKRVRSAYIYSFDLSKSIKIDV